MNRSSATLGANLQAHARKLYRANLIALLAVALTSSCVAAPRDVATTSVEGRTIAYRVLGHGRPIVVMISGLGDGMHSFDDVAPEIAKFATVIVYDRAGYGASDRAPAPRDAEAVDRELSGLLKQIGVQGPYVILGHSVSGLFAEYYAAKHPNFVSGLILEESRPADFTRRCEAAKIGMCVAPALAVRFMPVGAQEECAALPATSAQVEGLAPAKNVAVLILSRAISEKATGFDAQWAAAQDDLALRYPHSQHLTTKSGHYIHRDQREWFINSVRSFLGGL